ncbi:oxygenase MpaB family protein [Nannocystis sp. SCPEA4]|uniref:oxygenase MpaB family protein n=1 Tax=Nannocystis sp. SCPEA4 TaxID=2996787 RepID=UPI0022711CF0|nr:oxygenase MpaB family protein [Nannocystis sp. SCPEA4]MCY1056315.1 oxygenase MpaB family protein [Nannocystis sp. SCPEA4]
MPAAPARVHNLPAARAQYGDLIGRLLPAFERTDPLADAAAAWLSTCPEGHTVFAAALRDPAGAPEPVAALLESVAGLPAWARPARLERAAHLFSRAGVVGGFVLGLRSLVLGYAAPAGNKPLAFSGRLREAAPRRLAETARFVTAVCEPGGLLPGGEGRAIALHVRLMHAQVRRLLLANGRWDRAAWAVPINQHDMLATSLLFSHVYLDGLRLFGLQVDADEADDYVHLWRLASWLLGVDAELVPDREPDARRLAECIFLTQGPPDADSRALTAALLQAPLQAARTPAERRVAAVRVRLSSSICRHLVGNGLGDALGVPAERHPFSVPLLASLLGGLDRLRAAVPPIDASAVALGRRYWDLVVDLGMNGETPTYPMPARLGRHVSAA